MARIKHLAIKTVDPERLAKFYVDVFELEIVNRSDKGAVYLTDGYLNLALLKARGDVPPGLNHFGFAVDDMEAVSERLEAAGMEGPKLRPNNPPYAEVRAIDPDGNMFDLSLHGYQDQEYQEDRAVKKKTKERV
jgi:catechol 2,3-dioxygenase-like lactoylglutathione lyase family enzyme